MIEQVEERTDLSQKWVIAYSAERSIWGICIWDDGEKALCVNMSRFTGELGYLFVIRQELRDKVDVFTSDGFLEATETIAELCTRWDAGAYIKSPKEKKYCRQSTMTAAEVDTIDRLHADAEKEFWKGLPRDEWPSSFLGWVRKKPELAQKYIDACKRASDGKAHRRQLRVNRSTCVGECYLVMDDYMNILRTYILDHEDGKFLLAEGLPGGSEAERWQDEQSVLNEINDIHGRQKRLRAMHELLPEGWSIPGFVYNNGRIELRRL